MQMNGYTVKFLWLAVQLYNRVHVATWVGKSIYGNSKQFIHVCFISPVLPTHKSNTCCGVVLQACMSSMPSKFVWVNTSDGGLETWSCLETGLKTSFSWSRSRFGLEPGPEPSLDLSLVLLRSRSRSKQLVETTETSNIMTY